MNLQTYLMIKAAYYDGMEKDATSMEQRMRSDQKKKDMKALDRAAKGGVRGLATEEAIKRQPTRAANLGVVSFDNTASTANTIPSSLITSESVNSPMYTDTINADDAASAANDQIAQLKQDLADARLDISMKDDLYNRSEDRNRAIDNMLGSRVKDLRRAAAKNNNRANTIRRQEEQLMAQNDAMNRMRRNASIGGAVGGAALVGGAGYMGANWLANKLKLTGRKALAAKLLGTAAGSVLGGAGGYYLGQNV